VTGYEVDSRGIRYLEKAKDFSLLHSIQTNSYGPSSLLSNEYRGVISRGVKQPLVST
jgi:hypothetical protein